MRDEHVEAYEEEAAARRVYGEGLQEMREVERMAEAAQEEEEVGGWRQGY